MKKIFAVLPNYELTELDIHPVNFNFQKNIRSASMIYIGLVSDCVNLLKRQYEMLSTNTEIYAREWPNLLLSLHSRWDYIKITCIC